MSASRSQAEPPPDEGVRFERLLADLSSRFVNLPPSEVDQQIEQGLQQIVDALDVDRSSLLEFSGDGKQFIVTHSWAKEGYPRMTGILISAELPWYTGMLLKGETLALSRLPEDFPEGEVREKERVASSGLRSSLAIPLKVSGRPLGALAIGCFRHERVWPAEVIPRLRLLGEVFANALARRNQSVSLQQAPAEVRELKARLEEENLHLRKEIDVAARAGSGIVGESEAIKRALVQVEQVAPTDAAVLLLGETGTGKELLAWSIHGLSARRGRTMMTVNCAALPPSLIEAELFGRERGAYTGALARQSGRFEVADGSPIIFRSLLEPARVRGGCLACRAYQDTEEPEVLALIQEWASSDDLERYLRSEDFRTRVTVMELASERPEIWFDTIETREGLERLSAGLGTAAEPL